MNFYYCCLFVYLFNDINNNIKCIIFIIIIVCVCVWYYYLIDIYNDAFNTFKGGVEGNSMWSMVTNVL